MICQDQVLKVKFFYICPYVQVGIASMFVREICLKFQLKSYHIHNFMDKKLNCQWKHDILVNNFPPFNQFFPTLTVFHVIQLLMQSSVRAFALVQL